MKQVVIFVLLTAAFIVLADQYFEHFISRENDPNLTTLVTVGMVLLSLAYLWYIVSTLLKILKLK